ncbi:hypothetical protein D9M69_590120 [compost metagenome]
MTQTQRAWLADEHAVHVIWLDVVHQLEQVGLVAPLQFVFQLESRIVVVANGPLVAPGDEDHFADAGRVGFIHRVLDQRLVHHRQHFLRDGFGGRQESGTQATDGKNSFLNFHNHPVH